MKRRLTFLSFAFIAISLLASPNVIKERPTGAKPLPNSSQVLLRSTSAGIDVEQSNYIINFEDGEDLSGLYSIDANNDEATWGVIDYNGIETGGCLTYSWNTSSSADDYAFTPGFDLKAGNTYDIKFYYKVGLASCPEKLKLIYNTSQSATGATVINDYGELTNTNYTQLSEQISITADDTYYFGFHCYSDADQFILYIDSVTIGKTGNDNSNSGGDTSDEPEEMLEFYSTPTTGSNGIINNTINAYYQDSEMNSWIGTDEGVTYYDGNEYITYRQEDGLGRDLISCIYQDHNGLMWIGTQYGGIASFDGTTFTKYTTSQGVPNNSIKTITQDSNNKLWIGTIGGVASFNGSTFDELSGLPASSGYDIAFDTNGDMYIAGANGVSKYDGSSITTYTTTDGLANNHCTALQFDASGNLWIGTGWSGLVKYDKSSFTTYTPSNGLVGDGIQDIALDGSGNLWIATFTGVSKYANNTFTNYTKDDGLPSKTINDIFVGTGFVVFSTEMGASAFVEDEFVNLSTEDGLIDNNVKSIGQDADGNMWFGTYNYGLSIFDGSIWTAETSEGNLPNKTVNCIFTASNNNMWVATDYGLAVYSGTEWTTYSSSNGLGDNDVYGIAEDQSGNIWIATNGGGVTKYDGSSFTTYTKNDGMVSNASISIATVGNEVYVGSYGYGVSHYDGTAWVDDIDVNELTHENIWHICADSEGNLWFASNSKGVTKYDGSSYTTFDYTTEGINDDDIHGIIEDNNGYIWLATERGISAYDGEFWVTYNEDSGMVDEYATTIFCDDNGDLWVGMNDAGIMKVNLGSSNNNDDDDDNNGGNQPGEPAMLAQYLFDDGYTNSVSNSAVSISSSAPANGVSNSQANLTRTSTMSALSFELDPTELNTLTIVSEGKYGRVDEYTQSGINIHTTDNRVRVVHNRYNNNNNAGDQYTNRNTVYLTNEELDANNTITDFTVSDAKHANSFDVWLKEVIHIDYTNNTAVYVRENLSTTVKDTSFITNIVLDKVNPTTITFSVWDWGDGATLDLESVEIYANATFEGDNGGGETPDALVAGFKALSDLSGQAPLMISLADTSSGNPNSWFWDYGDGTSEYTQTGFTMYSYSTPGTYTVALTVTNDTEMDTETKVNYVTVLPANGPTDEVEGNDSYETANQLNLNGYIDGSLGNGDNNDWFKVTIPYDGALILSSDPSADLSSGIGLFNTDGSSYINGCTVCGDMGETDSLMVYNLVAGTYYIKIDVYSGQGTYTLKNTFVATTLPNGNDIGSNDTYEEAITLVLDETKTGHLGYVDMGAGDTKDWYKVSIPYDGALTVVVNPDYSLSSGLGLFNTDGESYINGCSVCGNTGETDSLMVYNLVAGTYYIIVEQYQHQGSYTITSSFEATTIPEGNDTESNDTYEDALSLALGETKTGHLGYKTMGATDTKDWYKVSIPYDGALTVVVNPDYSLSSGLGLFNTDGESYINGCTVCGNTGETDSLMVHNLVAGTYYIKVEEYYSTYGSYSITSSFEATTLPTGNDIEPNNSYTDAIALALDESKTGHLGYKTLGNVDGYDWYKVTTTQKGTLSFTVTPDYSLSTGIGLFDTDGTSYLQGCTDCGDLGEIDILVKDDLEAGTYYLRIEQYSGQGSYTVTASTEEITPSLSASFQTDVTSGPAPLLVQFTDQSVNATSWKWDFDNDGTVDSELQNPSYTYTTAGTYSVKLTVGDGTNSADTLKTNIITASASGSTTPLSASFKADITSGQTPLLVQFTDQSVNATTWKWDFNNDGTVDSEEQSPSYTYTEANTYSVKLTVSDGTTSVDTVMTDFISATTPLNQNGWTKVTSGTDKDLLGVCFPSENIGYAVGKYYNILKTTDAGLTWELQNEWKWDNYMLRAVDFFNDNIGWAVGYHYKIFFTEDGGTTWTSQNNESGSGLYDVKALSATTAIACGVGGKIYKLSNGTWTSTTIEGANYLTSMNFFDDKIGWISDWDGNVYKTTDAGQTWNTYSTGSTDMLMGIYIIDENILYTAGSTGKLYKSTNGGVDWSIEDDNTIDGAGCLSGHNDDIIWILDGDDSHYSLDAGTTWIKYDGYIPSDDACFTSKTSGCAVAGNSIYLFRGEMTSSISQAKSSSISLYPNPATSQFTVKANDNIQSIQVFDMNGALVVENMAVNATQDIIDTNHLENGLYLVKITSSNASAVKQLVIK